MESIPDAHELEFDPQLDGEAGRRARKPGRDEPIPDVVIRRLPIYARTLEYLRDEGAVHVSSEELGDRIAVSAAQIRRDLAYFGDFGKQGKGYHVEFLLGEIKAILQLQHRWNLAIVGLGDLGHALARYAGWEASGFRLAALFDHSAQKQGQRVGALAIQGMAALAGVLRARDIRIAIIAVPASAAQAVADQLVAAGVQAILNYAPTVVKVPRPVSIRHIDAIVMLQSMPYYLPGPGEE